MVKSFFSLRINPKECTFGYAYLPKIRITLMYIKFMDEVLSKVPLIVYFATREKNAGFEPGGAKSNLNPHFCAMLQRIFFTLTGPKVPNKSQLTLVVKPNLNHVGNKLSGSL